MQRKAPRCHHTARRGLVPYWTGAFVCGVIMSSPCLHGSSPVRQLPPAIQTHASGVRSVPFILSFHLPHCLIFFFSCIFHLTYLHISGYILLWVLSPMWTSNWYFQTACMLIANLQHISVQLNSFYLNFCLVASYLHVSCMIVILIFILFFPCHEQFHPP